MAIGGSPEYQISITHHEFMIKASGYRYTIGVRKRTVASCRFVGAEIDPVTTHNNC